MGFGLDILVQDENVIVSCAMVVFVRYWYDYDIWEGMEFYYFLDSASWASIFSVLSLKSGAKSVIDPDTRTRRQRLYNVNILTIVSIWLVHFVVQHKMVTSILYLHDY